MKKLFFLAFAAALLASCSLPTRLVNSAVYTDSRASQPAATVLADLEVSPTKISYFMIPTKAVLAAGEQNVLETAISEALLANGNADVLVSLNTQKKYNAEGELESITVTGYPAKYVNFRSPDNELLLQMLINQEPETKAGPLGGIFKKK